MAIVIPDIQISDGTVYRSLRGNAVADGGGIFRNVVTGCGVSDGREYYVLGDYSVSAQSRVCNRIPDPIVVNSFDYLVFKYVWTESAGRDLDTATVISEPRDLEVGGVRVGNVPLGFGFGAYYVSDVILNAGDNQGSGSESILYDFRKFVGLDADVVPEIVIESYATWFSLKKSGNITIEIKAYKGGTMSQSGHDYVNTGGKVVTEKVTEYIPVAATQRGPDKGVSDYKYSHTLTLKYNTRNQSISLTPYY